MGKNNRDMKEKTQKIMWPLSGANATDILKTEFQVMIAADVFATSNFQIFYSEWLQNINWGDKRQIFVPRIANDKKMMSFIANEAKFHVYEECDDYTAYFHRVKDVGNWLFITNDEKNAENIIKTSKETGIYLRVYQLDKEGKLRNFRFSVKANMHQQRKKEIEIDRFELTKQIVPIQEVRRIQKCSPQKGDVVYTSDNQPIRLLNEFISNPQSITYQTNNSAVQAKIYQIDWLHISYFEEKAKLMLTKKIEYEGVCWPIDLLYNDIGEFVGILIPAAEGYQLKQEVMSQQGLEKNFPNWDRRELTHLTKVILEKIVYLQDRNVLFGLINPSAIFVKDENQVFFVEMDTYQIEGYPVLSYEKVMQAPELQDMSDTMRLYTKQQDNYGIALLVFMLLMPGKFPYNKGKYNTISESIKNMTFAFRYGKNGGEHGVRESFGLWRFVWSHLGSELKQAFYYTFQHEQPFSSPEKRRYANFWLKKVEILEKELQNPYDVESLRLFPRTFKRFSGMKTIKCTKCGIEHPDFYYKYQERNICNSCLGKPSQTHFVCKSCGKAFYYDFGTLFKYEKLVETKGFEMPTHCPYCRSDKRKCNCCGKLVPSYRINDKGMCIDCAKIAREQIVKRYMCKCCSNIIELKQGEVDFHMKKFGRLPQRCEECRNKRS